MYKNVILGLSLLGLLMTSCGNQNTTSDHSHQSSITFEHKLGTTNIPQAPQKVVIFDIGALETFDELGLPVIGLPLNSLPEHLHQYKTKEGISDIGTVKEANFEKVHALNPDLIIISTRLEASYDEFSQIAPTIFYDIDPQDYISSFKKNTRLIGKLYNQETEVETILDNIDQEIKRVQEKVKMADQNALIVLFNNASFSAFGKGSRFGFIHDVLGIKAADEGLELSRHGQKVSNEYILATNPDILYVVDRNSVVNRTPTNQSDVENVLIQETKAYKNGKIYYLDPFIWYLSQGGITSTREMIKAIDASIE